MFQNFFFLLYVHVGMDVYFVYVWTDVYVYMCICISFIFWSSIIEYVLKILFLYFSGIFVFYVFFFLQFYPSMYFLL